MNKMLDTLHISLTIARKDIREALTNRGIRTNMLILIGIVLFFYWASTIRPFDRRVEVVVFDQSGSNLDLKRTKLGDGSELDFRFADSIQDLEKKMEYQDLGLVIPPDFNLDSASANEVNLSGMIYWAQRGRITELESEYSAMFSELLGAPVLVKIGDNILIPATDALGMAATASFHIFFAVFWMAVTVVPFLLIEERQTKTLDALMVSPASPGQVVMGKALAGLVFVIIIAGFALALNRIYVIQWGWVILGFLLSAIFAIGLALLLGSLVPTGQLISLWMLPVVIIFLIPAFFADEPNLAPGLKSILKWLPSTALARVLGYSVSNQTYPASLWLNLGIVLVSILVVYGLVTWRIRQSDK
jgi:ABC-2 type transport system permease protein